MKPVLIASLLKKEKAQEDMDKLCRKFINAEFCIKEENSKTWSIYSAGRFGFLFSSSEIKTYYHTIIKNER